MKSKINRYERKWIYKNDNYFDLINSLLRSNLFFSNQHSQRKVNSIYFDTFNYTSARENIDGSKNKLKIRIRWYGNETIINNPSLEIKKKQGFITEKQTRSILNINNLKFNNYKNLLKIKKIVNDLVKTSQEIIPTSSTHYDRQYFVSSNQNIRATVDFNIKSIFLKNNSQLNITRNYSNKSILELKYSAEYDEYVRKSLSQITLRLSKNSKFIGSLMDRPNYIF